MSHNEWLETCLQHQVTLEQNIASCTGITLSQASNLIMALGQAAVPDSFKSVLARAVLSKISGSTAGQGIQKQQCTHLEAFFTKRQWDEMLGNMPSDQHMFRVLSPLVKGQINPMVYASTEIACSLGVSQYHLNGFANAYVDAGGTLQDLDVFQRSIIWPPENGNRDGPEVKG